MQQLPSRLAYRKSRRSFCDQGDDIVDVAAISKEGAESQPIRAGQMLSITKLQAAGFCDVVDSEDMLVAMLSELQEQRVLPR